MTTTIAQHLHALELANEVRRRNSETKQQVAELPTKDGLLAVAEILESPAGPVGAIPVGSLLAAVHRMGPVYTRPLLTRAGIYNAQRRVRELTPRQRKTLAHLLYGRAHR